jgi:hypothetical protein
MIDNPFITIGLIAAPFIVGFFIYITRDYYKNSKAWKEYENAVYAQIFEVDKEKERIDKANRMWDNIYIAHLEDDNG